MNKAVGYSIIESDRHAELVEAVGGALEEGWQPQGGLVIWYEPSFCDDTGHGQGVPSIVHYAQALVKYE